MKTTYRTGSGNGADAAKVNPTLAANTSTFPLTLAASEIFYFGIRTVSLTRVISCGERRSPCEEE
jgi:hypothetical protein